MNIADFNNVARLVAHPHTTVTEHDIIRAAAICLTLELTPPETLPKGVDWEEVHKVIEQCLT